MGGYAGSAWAGACLLFLSLHAAVILLDTSRAGLLNYPFLIAAPLIGLFAIRRLAAGTASTVRIAWMLLAVGFLIWCGGAVAAAWADTVLGSSPMVADLSDFLYISYGIAIIAALALPDRPALVRRLAWIDVAQSLLAALLCYVAVFAVMPFSARGVAPIPSSRMANILTVENLALVVIATLRVMGRSLSPRRAAFDRAALMFLALYAASADTYNSYAIRNAFSAGLISLLPDLPFLSLLLLRTSDAAGAETTALFQRRPLTLLVDGATPAFFTLLLLWLALSIAQTRFMLGAMAMVMILLLMVVRSAITESHHLQAQDALALARDRLLRLSLHDDLTGVANRRAFQAALADRWSKRAEDTAPLSLLLIDIDHFKAINDRLGHEAGDTCLRMVASALEQTLREPAGGVFRYGGEEFAVLLPGTAPARAAGVAETLRAAVFRLAIPNRTATGDRVTISIGIASTGRGHKTPSRLISAADRALYEAKAGGRNRVSSDEDAPECP